MHKNSESASKRKFDHSLKIKKENIICKDGFCTIPTKNETSRLDKDDINIFDPV